MEFLGQPISTQAYDVLWESAMPGLAKPAVLHCESPGDTVDQRRRVVREVTDQLHRGGYAGPRGTFDEVAAVLNTLGRPRLAVDVRLYEWESVGAQARLAKFGARVAVSGWSGAVAVLGREWFQAWTFPVTSLVDEVIRLFASHDSPPRYFSGVSLYPDQLGANVRPARRGTEAILRLMESPYLRRAHVCAVARDQIGGADRVSESLVLNDIQAGRYLVFMARNQLTIAPGDRGTLERKLKEMVEPGRRN